MLEAWKASEGLRAGEFDMCLSLPARVVSVDAAGATAELRIANQAV